MKFCQYLMMSISFARGVDYLHREFYVSYEIYCHLGKFHSASYSSRCWYVFCNAARAAMSGDGQGAHDISLLQKGRILLR